MNFSKILLVSSIFLYIKALGYLQKKNLFCYQVYLKKVKNYCNLKTFETNNK